MPESDKPKMMAEVEGVPLSRIFGTDDVFVIIDGAKFRVTGIVWSNGEAQISVANFSEPLDDATR